MLVHFSSLPHLMVTIETDDQTGLVATKAVSVSKSELKQNKTQTKKNRFNLFGHSGRTDRITELKVLFRPMNMNFPFVSEHTISHPYLLFSFITIFSAAVFM